jgi:hypothetical protein
MGSGSLVPAVLLQEPGTVTVAPRASAQDTQRIAIDFITDMMFPPLGEPVAMEVVYGGCGLALVTSGIRKKLPCASSRQNSSVGRRLVFAGGYAGRSLDVIIVGLISLLALSEKKEKSNEPLDHYAGRVGGRWNCYGARTGAGAQGECRSLLE